MDPVQSDKRARPLEGKTAIVTGSTSGIGLGIAHRLASQGCNIVLNGSRAAPDSLVSEFEKAYDIKAVYSQADFSDAEKAAQSVIKTAVDSFGTVDILVNNAGIQHVSPVESFPVEAWDRVIAINLTSCFHLIRLSIPLMKEHPDKYGRIINISSVHGIVASVNKAAYVSAKHGLNGLTKVVALETASDTGITSNAICPGWVKTPIVEAQIQTLAKQKNLSIEAATMELLGQKQPSKKFTTPEQIGDMVTFLCSPSASNITGSIQVMDGAWTTQ
jgi:3-hydroxybutyrate dehydrogenase